MSVLRGGPFDDGREPLIHSLVVHMRGDGRSSSGAYVRARGENDEPLDYFEWHPEPEWPPEPEINPADELDRV